MRVPSFRRPSGYEAIAIVLALGATGGVAYAAIPSNGVITACYTKSGGALRVIDATTGNCSARETKLQWNMQGVAGPPGPAGSDGSDGVSGYEIVTASENLGPFDTDGRIDTFATCPAGKKVLSGTWAYYTKPSANSAFQYTMAERVNTEISTQQDGTSTFIVSAAYPPSNTQVDAKLDAQAVCATVAP